MLSFATIVYARDYPLLELQARSMARFVNPAEVASILIVLNTDDEGSLQRALQPVLAAYGPLRDKVHILVGDALLRADGRPSSSRMFTRLYVDHRFRIPFVRRHGWRGNNGYRMQQALKLASARAAQSRQIVILDAKNLFLRPVRREDFFDDDGRGRLPFCDVVTDFHRAWLLESLDALDVAMPDLDTLRTTIFATPFPFDRSLVLELLDEIEKRYETVQALFASRRRPSEFMLINAFCIRKYGSVAACYQEVPSQHVRFWPTDTQEAIMEQVDRLERPDVLSFSLHNRVISNLPEMVRNRVFKALEARQICDRETAERVLAQTVEFSR